MADTTSKVEFSAQRFEVSCGDGDDVIVTAEVTRDQALWAARGFADAAVKSAGEEMAALQGQISALHDAKKQAALTPEFRRTVKETCLILRKYAVVDSHMCILEALLRKEFESIFGGPLFDVDR